jgi:hypothetical protein
MVMENQNRYGRGQSVTCIIMLSSFVMFCALAGQCTGWWWRTRTCGRGQSVTCIIMLSSFFMFCALAGQCTGWWWRAGTDMDVVSPWPVSSCLAALLCSVHWLGNVLVGGGEPEHIWTWSVGDLYQHAQQFYTTILSHTANCCGRYKLIWTVSCTSHNISHPAVSSLRWCLCAALLSM